MADITPVEEPGSVTKKPSSAVDRDSSKMNSSGKPWWRDLSVPRLSVHDEPVCGLKVSKTFNLRGLDVVDNKTSVTVGAMADYTSKQAHLFAKCEHMLDDSGKIAIDVTGVELQKQFDALEGVLRANVSIGAGVSWDGKPYINFDAMPKSALMKGVGLATAIHQGRSIDLRPTRPLNETLSLEAPFSLYRDGSELNVQVHGVIGAVSLPNSDFYITRKRRGT